MENQPVQEKVKVGTESLKSLAIYLSGLKDGKGNLLPLGTVVLEDLWNAINYLDGDARFTAKRCEKGSCGSLQLPDDFDSVIQKAIDYGWVFINGLWKKDGFHSRTSEQLYVFVGSK